MRHVIVVFVQESSIFQYSDPIEFLNASIQQMQTQNSRFSMRAWAAQLGLNHVAMLSMVLSKKRKLLPSLSSKISTQFRSSGKFTENEARYFDILVLFQNAKSIEEKNFYESILSSLKPDQKFSTLELDQQNAIAEWYHTAILDMTYLKDFTSDPQWISLRLGDNVNATQVEVAIQRLLRLGLLEKTPDGKLKKTSAFLATPTDIPSKGLRKFHREMILKAEKAIESQAIENRDITAATFSIDKKKLPEAKRMIRQFRRKLAQYLASSEGDSVYSLNIQLFDLLEQSVGESREK